jgi:hypothetical protein
MVPSIERLSVCDVVKYTRNDCLKTKGERDTIKKI